MVGVVFNQHHIADIGAAGDGAFKQVVAEHSFRIKPLVKDGVNGLDIDQALACEGAHAEDVLVEVGCAAAVRVDAALACKHGVKG